MSEQAQKPDTPTAGNGRPIWQRARDFLLRPHARFGLGAILAVGVVGGVVGWGGFNWAMEMTNTETFCIGCHEMERNVYREYKRTIHYQNRTGVRATCPDCHVPKEWVHKVIRKIQATNELYHHFLGTIDTREKYEVKRLELAGNVWRAMQRTDSRECRNCHSFDYMDLRTQESRSVRRHQQAIAEGKTCIDCHKGIAHDLPKGAFEQEREINRQIQEQRQKKG